MPSALAMINGQTSCVHLRVCPLAIACQGCLAIEPVRELATRRSLQRRFFAGRGVG